MTDLFLVEKNESATPIWALKSDEVADWNAAHAGPAAAWAQACDFKGEAGRLVLLPDSAGGISGVLLGLGDGSDPFLLAAAAAGLPKGKYRLATTLPDPDLAVLGWAFGTYVFSRYKKSDKEWPQLVLPDQVDVKALTDMIGAVFLVRDLVNIPAGDLGPGRLAEEAEKIAGRFDAEIRTIVGDALLAHNYPMVHAVGRAAAEAPRLIDMRWGKADAPRLTLVGKGVCFDTGGLDIKPGSAMALMKKDMGGAAHVLGLASLIMAANLPVRLRVLIPAVENAISGNAFRPGDILPSRKGLTVEIGNTDAEGRLILADALAEADGEEPDLLIDMATLTGAARVALGPELPPFYTDDDAFAADLAAAATATHDPVWRLPLWRGYMGWLDSKIADINHISDGPFAGSITAALFLRRFVERARTYVHFDIYAWNAKPKPGRPVGGEAQALRALFHLIQRRYGD